MKKPLLWLAGIALVLIAFLAWVAYAALEKAEELANQIRTAPARAARHPNSSNQPENGQQEQPSGEEQKVEGDQ